MIDRLRGGPILSRKCGIWAAHTSGGNQQMRNPRLRVFSILLAATVLVGCAPAAAENDSADVPESLDEVVAESPDPEPEPTPEGIALAAQLQTTDGNGYSYTLEFALDVAQPTLDSSQDLPGNTSVVFPIMAQGGQFTNTTEGDYDVRFLGGQFGYTLRPVFNQPGICAAPTARALPGGQCFFYFGGGVVWESPTVSPGAPVPATAGDATVVRADGIPAADAGALLGEFAIPVGMAVMVMSGNAGATAKPGDFGGLEVPTLCSLRIGDTVGQGEWDVVAETPGLNVCG